MYIYQKVLIKTVNLPLFYVKKQSSRGEYALIQYENISIYFYSYTA